MKPTFNLRPSVPHEMTVWQESSDGPIVLRYSFPSDAAKYDWMEEPATADEEFQIKEAALARRINLILYIGPGSLDGWIIGSRVLPGGDTEFFYDGF